MAYVQDRWTKTVDGQRVPSAQAGRGKRWRARYLDPDGAERAKDFDRKQDADQFLAAVTADVLRGAYVDPNAAGSRSATSPSGGSPGRRSAG